jgi:hypothetical protein
MLDRLIPTGRNLSFQLTSKPRRLLHPRLVFPACSSTERQSQADTSTNSRTSISVAQCRYLHEQCRYLFTVSSSYPTDQLKSVAINSSRRSPSSSSFRSAKFLLPHSSFHRRSKSFAVARVLLEAACAAAPFLASLCFHPSVRRGTQFVRR